MAITRTYAVGEAGRVIRLDNHTGPWVDITPNFPNEEETWWHDVMTDPLDPDKVTIVGQENLGGVGSGILVSTDAGVNWTIPLGNWPTNPGTTTKDYKEVWYVDSRVIWAIAEGGIVVLSTDYGVTFNTVSQPDKSLMAQGACIHALDEHIAVVAGTPDPNITTPNTYVWKTIDGGVNWTRLNSTLILPGSNGGPVGRPEGIWISANQERIVVGCHYSQVLSIDNGASFNAVNAAFLRSGQHLTWFPSHSPNPPTMRHVGGDTFQVNESTDNGSIWSITRQGAGFTMLGAHFWDVNDGYYTNDHSGNIESTNDGGVTGSVSYNSPDGFPLYAVWTQLAIVDPPEGCPCYLATECDNPDNQVAIQIDCLVHDPLVPGTVYQFSSPDSMVDRCWTVEETECPEQETINLASGLDCDGNLGEYNDQDCQWNVTNIVSGVTPIGSPLPFPARVANQLWYGGGGNFTCDPPNNNYSPYGSQIGSKWITVGQLNNNGATPHTQDVATAAYELQFTPPINFIPNLHLEFLIDNTATFFLNGIQVNPSNSPTCPWSDPYIIDINLIDNAQATFLPGVNILRAETFNQGAFGSNGINITGEISNASPPSLEATPDTEWLTCDSCINPITPNICWDLEVACEDTCDDIYAITGFDFTPYIGQNITIQPPLTDPECWYTPYALRQAVFIAVPQSAGGGYNLSWPFGAFQLGADDITISIPSFIHNSVEQITGSPPTNLMTPANIQFVLCQQMSCANVPINNPGGLTGYANTVDFINATLSSLGIFTMQAYNNSFDNCPITQVKPKETFRLQYRDGDTFIFTLQYSNIGQGVVNVVYEVQAGNITISYLAATVSQPQQDLTTCNDNIYCLTDPLTSPEIYTATIMGDCPVEPVDLGKACDIVPRLGEPGFSVKNCDPDKVIDVKCKYADSVYAQFKRVRYGIDTCCEFDLDKIDIKNQLIDLGTLYDPDMCVDGTPIPEDCCLQPCNAEVEIMIPEAIACPAPIDVDAVITIPAPPIPETTCFNVTFTITATINSDVHYTVAYTDCCGVKQLIELIPNAGAITSVTACVDTAGPYEISTGITPSITDEVCLCCPEPFNLEGNTKPVRPRVGIDTAICRTMTVVGVDDGNPPTSFIATACNSAAINVVVLPGVPQVFCVNQVTGYVAGPNVQVTISGTCV